MTARLIAIVVILLIAVSCASSRGPRGGEPERQLAVATAAGDVDHVTRLLKSGADPNRMVSIDGNTQSPWALALRQLRPQHPERIAIVIAMLDAGASPVAAWGDASPRGPETFWQSLQHARNAGIQDQSPLRLVMFHPDVTVVRALIAKGISSAEATAQLVPAVEAAEDEIARLLVDAGADVNWNGGATTALVAAIERRDVALMQFLEDHGAREKP